MLVTVLRMSAGEQRAQDLPPWPDRNYFSRIFKFHVAFLFVVVVAIPLLSPSSSFFLFFLQL